MTGKRFDAPPSIAGYNLCYLRPQANLAAVTVDEYKAPVVASWQAGAGRRELVMLSLEPGEEPKIERSAAV